MRPSAVAVAALTLSGCAALSRPTAEDLQRDYARMLRPVAVRAAAAEAPVVTRTMTVRAYADAEYRGHAPDWEQRIAGQVQGASAVVERDFGVRLALETIRPWDREGALPDVGDALDALVAHDPSREVDWVVGFVAPMPEDSGREHEKIGIARNFGRHFVLRAMMSAAELAQIGASYDELTEEEQAAMVRDRRVHREISVFLHEWGHTLGAVHECDDKWLMAPRYSVLHSAFSPESTRLIRVALEHRDLAFLERIERLAPAWRAEVARMQGVVWECAKLEEGLAAQEKLIADGLRRAASQRYGRAVNEAVRARLKLPEGAASALDPKPARVEARLDRAGALRAVKLVATSGVPGWDETALAAIRAAQPFAPPPPELDPGTGELVLELVVRIR